MRSKPIPLVLLTLSLMACSSGPGDDGAGPGPDNLTGPTAASATGSTAEVGPPLDVAQTTASTGIATLALSGDLTGSYTLDSFNGPALVGPPPGGPFSVNWVSVDEINARLTVGGDPFVGEAETTATLGLSFYAPVPPDGNAHFTSVAGECTLTIGTMEAATLSGSFECTALPSDDGAFTVDASGTFQTAP